MTAEISAVIFCLCNLYDEEKTAAIVVHSFKKSINVYGRVGMPTTKCRLRPKFENKKTNF